jgi:hypothetical protein
MAHRALILCMLVFAACRGSDSTRELASATHVPRTCTKDVPWLEELMAQTVIPPACFVDEDCPCGSFCNTSGSCEAQCITTEHATYGCSGAQVCDNWGLCGDPAEPPPPTTTPTLRLAPQAIAVAPLPIGQEYPASRVDVSLEYAGTTGPHPTLAIAGTEDRVPVCPDGTQSCPNPTIEIVRELEVRCGETDPWSEECPLSGPWVWQPGGAGLVATKPIWVRPKQTARAAAWELRVIGEGSTSNDEAVTLTLEAAQSFTFDGRYEGRLYLGGMKLDVSAFARNGQLVIVDPTRTVSGSGKLPIGTPPSTQRFAWLGDADGEMIAAISVDTRAFDASTGVIETTFRLTLPVGGDGRAGTTSLRDVTGHAVLRRAGDNEAPVCTASCFAGTSCETTVGLCLPGAAWQASAATAPANGLADPAFDSWGQAVRPQLATLGISPTVATADAIERLSCYQPDWSPSQRYNGVFHPTVMQQSGDLRCASNGAPWSARATIRPDAGDAAIDVGDLLLACLTDLEASPPATATAQTLAKSPCVSLARLLPGLEMAIDGALSSESSHGREATIAQELVRGWLEVAGFVMQQGEDDVGLASSVALADGTEVAGLAPLSRLLDRADAAWKAVLQAPVIETLSSLDPRHLRAPDYRRHAFAAMHWPGTSNTDAVANRTLSLAPSCGSRGEWNSCDADQTAIIDPLEVDMSGDASAAFHMAFDTNKPYQNERLVIDSPGMSVRLAFDGVHYREKHYKRNAPIWAYVNKPNWYECRQSCATVGYCVAWSYMPSASEGERCRYHGEVGTRASASGQYSGVISLEPHNGLPAAQYTQHFQDTEIQGNTLQTLSGTSFAACFDACSTNTSCAAITHVGTTCYLKSAVPALFRWVPGVNTAIMPSVNLSVSHLTSSGQSEKVTVPLHRSWTIGDTLSFDRKLVVTRNTADGYYRVYVNGTLRGQTRYSKPPGRWPGRVRVGRRDNVVITTNGIALPEFEAADEVGLWTTALDDFEVMSIQSRSVATSNYLTRGALTIPATNDHDQSTGLAVTLLEAADRYNKLLARHADQIAGDAHASCVGEAVDPTVLEGARQRIGDGLRKSLLVEQVAADLESRAKQVECDFDAQCGSEARCGAAASYRIDALSSVVAQTGMQTCYGPIDTESIAWPTGLCSTYNGVVSMPGSVATATFTFDVETPGTYGLWGRFLGQKNKQSFWVRIDNGPWLQWSVGISAVNHWHWAQKPGGAVALTAGTHTVTLGVREGGTIVDELALEADYAMPPEQRRSVCVASDGTPVETTLPWQQKLDQARTIAAASRDRLTERVNQLNRCESPFGMSEIDAPLFFTDPGPSAFDRYFASSNYLMDPSSGRATTAVNSALAAVLSASQALDQRRDDDYQLAITQQAHEARLDGIRASYDAQLGVLCGPAGTPPGGMLHALANGTIAEEVCFVAQTPECIANASEPVRSAVASCYSGALGEATIAIKGAALDVDAARLDWNARQNELENKSAFCAELEETGDMIAKHNAHMEKLRKRKAMFDKISGAVSLAAGLSTGGLSFMSTLSECCSGQGNPNGWDLGASGSSVFETFFSGGMSLLSGVLGAPDLEAEQQKWNELMQARSNELEVMECWDQASAMRDQIGIAQNRIQRATVELELATGRLSNARREVSRLVQAGTAELAREADRMVVAPQHHDWLDQRITSYEKLFAWAKKLTYLAVRAIEHDFQQSTGMASRVLEATNPFELQSVLQDLDEAYYFDPLVCGQRPQSGRAIVRLSELAGLQPGTLGAYLQTDEAIIRDARGTSIGRGVRFALDPNSATGLTNRSSERVWGMTGSVQVDGEFPESDVAFSLFKRATFFSRWCGEPMPDQDPTYQIGIHRPRQNLFADSPSGMTNFADAVLMQASTIQNLKNITEAELRTNEYPTATVNNFAGQGLFGDYAVMFPTSGPDAIDLDHVEDVLLRLDYVYVDGGPVPAP